jgi:hypothetical protein
MNPEVPEEVSHHFRDNPLSDTYTHEGWIWTKDGSRDQGTYSRNHPDRRGDIVAAITPLFEELKELVGTTRSLDSLLNCFSRVGTMRVLDLPELPYSLLIEQKTSNSSSSLTFSLIETDENNSSYPAGVRLPAPIGTLTYQEQS